MGGAAHCHMASPPTPRSAPKAAVCRAAGPPCSQGRKPSCLTVEAGPGPGVTGEPAPTTYTELHSQKALLFNNIFVAGKFCEFVL